MSRGHNFATINWIDMAKRKLIPLDKITERGVIDSVAESKELGNRRALDVLLQAQTCWDNMDRFRKERERNKRYMYGDQWGDVINVDGKSKTEEEYIMEQGRVPLKNNLIRRLVRNVIGVYRQQSKEPTCVARDRDEQRLGETMSVILQYNMQLNKAQKLYARSMEEFLMSGLIAHKKTYGWRRDRLDCWTDVVNPNRLFMDPNMRDFRGWDVSLIGEVHDVSFEDVCTEFAKSPEDYYRLKRIYTNAGSRRNLIRLCDQFGYPRRENYEFLFTGDPTRCRVIEVWRKESKQRIRCHDFNTGELYKIELEDEHLIDEENDSRIAEATALGMSIDSVPLIKKEYFIDGYWYFYYLTPFGDILREGETEYGHKEHPYVFEIYPFLDGEIHSFVSDFIDQQRYTNRLVTLYDWIVSSSAKGVLLFPEEMLPEGMKMEDIAEQWTRFDGIIAYNPKPGVPMPQQISSNSTNIGITELLNLQLKFFEDISGVNGALQGKPGYSGTSASLYALQSQNAATSLLDLLETFSGFVVDCAYKDVKNIQKFYDTKKRAEIAGKKAVAEYDPEKMADVEFDLSIVESTTTPVFRQMANDTLMQLWQAQAISVEQLLENGDFPFADNLLQSIKSNKEQMQNLPPEVVAQAQQGADMQAVDKAYGMLKG